MGRAQAVRFAQEGADIIAVDVCAPVEHSTTPGASPEDFAETVRQVESLGRKICAFEADVRDQQALTSAVDAGVEALGGSTSSARPPVSARPVPPSRWAPSVGRPCST